MSSFTSKLRVEPVGEKNWKLLQSFSYHVGTQHSRTIIKVPRGFITDFASIPQLVISILGLVSILTGDVYNNLWFVSLGVIAILASALLPDWGRWGKAAIIHDYLYHTKQISRKMSDLIFLEAMEVLGVSLVERYSMYYAVRLFGWIRWR